MKNRILVVDDVELNRDLLKAILDKRYEIEEACDGQQALEILIDKGDKIDLVLLDLLMPVMDGFEVLTQMKKSGVLSKIPVLVVTGEFGTEAENQCLELGAIDFVYKPYDATLIKNRIKNVLELFEYRKALEAKVEIQTQKLRSQYQMLQHQAEKLRENNDKIVEILGTVVEHRNLESGEHIRRVKMFTQILARSVMQRYPEYNLTEAKIREIVVVSALHDVGKITISDRILLKPGRLTVEEFEYMKSHTTRGCEMLSSIHGIWTDEYRKTCYDICRWHHERYDGKGYPDGLKGDEIPISAQIVSVADAYDTLVSELICKKAYTKEDAFHMILNGECGVFSPKLMECFRQVKEEFEAV